MGNAPQSWMSYAHTGFILTISALTDKVVICVAAIVRTGQPLHKNRIKERSSYFSGSCKPKEDPPSTTAHKLDLMKIFVKEMVRNSQGFI